MMRPFWKKKPAPRIVMTILVRDEIDIIRHNIEFHRNIGVDYFVVTDNGSKDGTRELLSELSEQGDIYIIDEFETTIQQDKWVTRMARMAFQQFNADWVINNDADEFWYPQSGNLKGEIPANTTVLECQRVNMLPCLADIEQEEYKFYDNLFRVEKPYSRQTFARAYDDESVEEPLHSIMMTRMLDKVMCEASGMENVMMGNHEVTHRNYRKQKSPGILVYHYPLRAYDSFRNKLINQATSVINNPNHNKWTSWHHLRWYQMYKNGLLEKEYERCLMDMERLEEWANEGVVLIDDTIQQYFRDNPLSTLAV